MIRCSSNSDFVVSPRYDRIGEIPGRDSPGLAEERLDIDDLQDP